MAEAPIIALLEARAFEIIYREMVRHGAPAEMPLPGSPEYEVLRLGVWAGMTALMGEMKRRGVNVGNP